MALAACRIGSQGENGGSGWLYFGSKNFDRYKYESVFSKMRIIKSLKMKEKQPIQVIRRGYIIVKTKRKS